MRKRILLTTAFLMIAVVAHAQPSRLPSFTLPDPHGGMHSSSQLVTDGLVAIVTAPTLRNKKAQSGWSEALASTKDRHPASLILIEDMTASAFRGIAEKRMRKAWQPGTIPILLQDDTGEVYDAFGMEKNRTKVFVYDSYGNLVYSDAGNPSREAAETIWDKIE